MENVRQLGKHGQLSLSVTRRDVNVRERETERRSDIKEHLRLLSGISRVIDGGLEAISVVQYICSKMFHVNVVCLEAAK